MVCFAGECSPWAIATGHPHPTLCRHWQCDEAVFREMRPLPIPVIAYLVDLKFVRTEAVYSGRD